MKEVRPWIAILGADSEIARELGKSLSERGFVYNWFSNAGYFLDSEYRIQPRCLTVDIDPDILSHSLISIETLINAHRRWPTVLLNPRGELPVTLKAMRIQHFEFIQQPFTGQLFMEAIDRTNRYNPYLQNKNEDANSVNLARGLARLTHREEEIAGEMIHGRSSKGIASRLSISVKTVEVHRTRVLHKMRVRNTAELIGQYLGTI